MASSVAAAPFNWSFHAIAGAFALGLVPHAYYLMRLMQATKGKCSTAMPRTNLDAWRGKLPENVWNHLQRARGAHLNSMEVFPLFGAAMVAGNVAGISAADMNAMALSFFAARSLYTAFYLFVGSETIAFVRTMIYGWSIAIPIMGLVKAGRTFSMA